MDEHIAMEDDPAQQGKKGDKDLPPNVDRQNPMHQSGGERSKLPDDRQDQDKKEDQSER